MVYFLCEDSFKLTPIQLASAPLDGAYFLTFASTCMQFDRALRDAMASNMTEEEKQTVGRQFEEGRAAVDRAVFQDLEYKLRLLEEENEGLRR